MIYATSALRQGPRDALSLVRESRRPLTGERRAAISLSQTYLCGTDASGFPQRDEQPEVRMEGASCQWPRACEWPMRDDRSVTETAKDVLESAAAAAAMAGATEWSRDAHIYVPNDIDTDLPPDIELLALFSDSPIAWRPHETSDDDIEDEDDALQRLGSSMMRWWRRTWRYQGLGL